MKLIQALRNSTQRLDAGLHDSTLFKHKGDRGEFRERIIEDFLRPFLPRCYGLGSGEIFSEFGQGSNQIDVVIFDDIFSNVLFRDKNNSLFPCESVFGTIEIKSILSTEELEIAINNIKSVKELPRKQSDMLDFSPCTRLDLGSDFSYSQTARNPYLGFIFAYKGLASSTVIKQLNEKINHTKDKQYLPDAIFNYERGYMIIRSDVNSGVGKPAIGKNFQGYMTIDLKTDTLPVFFLTLNTYLNQIRLKAPNFGEYLARLLNERQIK